MPKRLTPAGACASQMFNSFRAEQLAEHIAVVTDNGSFVAVYDRRRFRTIFALFRRRFKKQALTRASAQGAQDMLGTFVTKLRMPLMVN